MGTPPITPQAPIPGPPPPARGWWSCNWKWFVPVGCFTFILLFGLFIVSVLALAMGSMKSSDVYRMAMEKAQANPIVASRMGTPLESGFFLSGSINVAGASGKAELTIPVTGPKGKGTIYLEATKFAGEWQFGRLEMGFADGGQRLDLLAEPVQNQ